MSSRRSGKEAGFTLLEVLVALTILGIGMALTLSLISGSLRNIRKTQLRTKVIQHAETVMELTLLDESIKEPRMLHGDFEDGTRWTVQVRDFELPKPQPLTTQQVQMPVKLFSYTVEVIGPGSQTADFRIETLKLIPVQGRELASPLGPPGVPGVGRR